MVWSSNPSRCENKSFSSPKRPDRLWGPSSLLLHEYRGSCSWVKRSEHDVKHTTSGTEVKIECRHASTLPVCLHGVGREILTFCNELCVCVCVCVCVW